MLVCSGEQFSFHMCLESGDGSAELLVTEDRVMYGWLSCGGMQEAQMALA